MGFKSQAQVARMTQLMKEGKLSKEKFHQWVAETPDISKLPERKSPAFKVTKARVIK